VENLEKIKDRIAKLLKMAEDASSPNEAAIAASRARRLMDQYQLDAFDVSNRIEEEFGDAQATRFYAAIPTHMDILAVAVAKYNDCQSKKMHGRMEHRMSTKLKREGKAREYGSTKRYGFCLMFLGYKSDTELAVQMYERLLETINRLCKEYLTGKGYERYPVNVGMQFKVGAALAIITSLEALTVERDAIMDLRGPGNSLMLIKSKNVEDHFGECSYKDSNIKQADADAEIEARTVGYIKGGTVEITPLVEGEEGEESNEEMKGIGYA
jgi:hypothetical protein